jgi:hypothetical protein
VFKNGEGMSGAESITPSSITKDSEAVYTLTVEHVPAVEKGIVLVTITKAGIAPPTRAWSLDGEVYENSLCVIVKYNSAGGAGAVLWARSVTGGGSDSQFYGVAADGKGGISAAGYQCGTGTFNYGDNKTAIGDTAECDYAVVVGYR